MGGNFTSYLLYFVTLSFYCLNNFLEVLTADLLRSDILLLLTFSNDTLS